MNEQQSFRPKARLPRGMRDRDESELAAERRMLDTIRRVYESYGFAALETSALEYADALGKFLPDQDRPNEGVFSFQDDDGQWLSLRYDLTAPLARYVAENFQDIPKPFRRYQVGQVFRNEKPGPGRFREFTQFDADTVGTASPAADAELLMMCADALEALGLKRGEYVIKVNNRKILDGVLEAAGIDASKRWAVFRSLDKLDRIGPDGVRQLLGAGRTDASGDVTKGAGLTDEQIVKVMKYINVQHQPPYEKFNPTDNQRTRTLDAWFQAIQSSAVGRQGIEELRAVEQLLSNSGYGDKKVQVDGAIIRGLDYYTGPVYEAQLTFPVRNDKGETVVFGSVGGGGRYDDLVARFIGQTVPASGISIGVSRLLAALKAREGAEVWNVAPLVVVTVLDKAEIASSFRMAQELRAAGIRAEAYVGTKKFGDQMKYADKRNAAIAVIEGSDERARGEVMLKDLALGAELAKSTADRAAWTKDRPAQQAVKRGELVEKVRAMLSGRGG